MLTKKLTPRKIVQCDSKLEENFVPGKHLFFWCDRVNQDVRHTYEHMFLLLPVTTKKILFPEVDSMFFNLMENSFDKIVYDRKFWIYL